MLITKSTIKQHDEPFSELQKVALQYLPPEQIRKFARFQHLIEKELLNEAREPEADNTMKDLFDALHEKNTPKLLKVLQGDKEKIFYAYKKQLESKPNLTKRDAKVLALITRRPLSLLSISLLKD